MKPAGDVKAKLETAMKKKAQSELLDETTKQRMREDRDANGMNAFHRAALEHNLKLVKEMFEIDKDIEKSLLLWVNSETFYGETPLLISAMLKHKGEVNDEGLNEDRENFIDFMLENGAQVNTSNIYTLWTPAHWAARHGDMPLLKKLLAKGAMPFTPDKAGYFPIDFAGKFEHWDIVKELVDVSLEKFKHLQTNAQANSTEITQFAKLTTEMNELSAQLANAKMPFVKKPD